MPVDSKPPKPVALPVSAAAIPQVLKDLTQWVVWHWQWVPERQQWTKPPYQVTGADAKSNTPATWTTFERAYASYEKGLWDGVGCVVREEQRLVGIDLDHCRDAETGDIDPTALTVVREINSYTEVSPSGLGLRIFAYGTLPPQGRKRGGVEMYSDGRYFTITGAHLSESPTTIEPRDEAILAVHTRIFRKTEAPMPTSPLTTTPTRLSDDEVLSRALAAKNAGKVSALWTGDLTGYASHSEADLSLVSMLAFWTQDVPQLDRLFRRSGLFRPKWDMARGDTTYGAETIAKALTRREVWRGLAPKPHSSVMADTPPAGVLGVEDLVDERVIWVSSPEEKALVQAAGYRSCLAVPSIPPVGGSYREALAWLKRLEKSLSAVKHHVLLFPNTIDGRAFSAELARRLGPEFIRMPIWPSECESLEHVQTVHGLDVVQEVIEHTKSLPLQDVIEFDSLRQRLHDLYRTGRRPIGLSPGWLKLAEIYRVRPGLVTLILGREGLGKSTVTAAMMVNIAKEHSWPLTIFSPEQGSPDDYAVTLLQQWNRAPFFDGPTQRMTLEDVDYGLDQLQESITLLWPTDKRPTVDYLLELARKEVFRRGIKGLVIDPWSKVSHDIQAHGREDLYIQEMLSRLTKFARTYQVHIWIVIHPPTLDREVGDDGQKKFALPTLPSGGQKWLDGTDNCLILDREVGQGERTHILWVHTRKIRFCGYDGEVSRKTALYFHQASGTFSDVGDVP